MEGICAYDGIHLSILLSSAPHSHIIIILVGIVEYSISRYLGLGATHTAWDIVWGV